jgi:hypothetical protein
MGQKVHSHCVHPRTEVVRSRAISYADIYKFLGVSKGGIDFKQRI